MSSISGSLNTKTDVISGKRNHRMHSSLTYGDHSEKEVDWEVTLILIASKFLKAYQTLSVLHSKIALWDLLC